MMLTVYWLGVDASLADSLADIGSNNNSFFKKLFNFFIFVYLVFN